MRKSISLICLIFTLVASGCSAQAPNEMGNIEEGSSETDMTDEFEKGLYSRLIESDVLSNQDFEVSAFASNDASVYVILKEYNGKAFAEAVTISTDYVKENASYYGISSPKLNVVSGPESIQSATWSSEDYENGIWTDTSPLEIGGKFPLNALLGTYNIGSTDDMAVYIESGGHWIDYHSSPNCSELAEEIETMENYYKQEYFALSVAKSSLSDKFKPCDSCC